MEVQAVRSGCAPQPSICGIPGLIHHGSGGRDDVPRRAGTSPSGPGWRYDPRGRIVVTGDGAVLSGLSTSVSVEANASNVTVANSASPSAARPGESPCATGTGTTIANSEISESDALGSGRLLVGIKDIYGDSTGTSAEQRDLHTSTGIQMDRG